MTVIEQKFLKRWIDLEGLYRRPLPVPKIWVHPGNKGPQPNFTKFDLKSFSVDRFFLQFCDR